MAELWETLTIGLILSLLFIGVSYFFWRRYDRPTPLMVEREEEKQRLKAERKTWRQVEAKMEAERLEAESKAQYDQRKAQERARAEPPKQEQVANAWGALGVGTPTPAASTSDFKTDGIDANALQRASVQGGLEVEEANDDDVLSVDELVQVRQDPGVGGRTEEPDWELIDKITEIAEKDDLEVPEVPDAPDLPSVDELLALSLEAPAEPDEPHALSLEAPAESDELLALSLDAPTESDELEVHPEAPDIEDATDTSDEVIWESSDNDDPWAGAQWSEE